METVRFFKEIFRVTPEEEVILKLTYTEPYLEFKDLPLFRATGVACPNVNSLLLYMENTEHLANEMTSLQDRISRGLSPSSSRYYDYVEQGLLSKLINESVDRFKKEIGEPVGNLNYNEINYFFNLPINRKALNYAKKQQAKIKDVPEPETKLTNIPLYYGSTLGDNSNYQTWGVLVDNLRYEFPKNIRVEAEKATGVSIGKLAIFETFNTKRQNYIQIYLYDYAGRDWAFQHVLQYLVNEKGLKLTKNKKQ